MNRRTMVVVPLAAVATIIITAATGGGSSSRLPLPVTVANGAPTHRAPGGNAHSGPGSGGSSSGGQGQIYTPPPPTPLAGCTVSVSNPAPFRGQTAEAVTVQTAAGAHVRLDADYSRRSTHGGLASSTGGVTFYLPINHAQVGFTVRVTATVSLRGVQRTCSTSFTPIL